MNAGRLVAPGTVITATCAAAGCSVQVLAYYGYVNLNWRTVTTAFLWGLDADRDGCVYT
jgi:hypothetical protein